MKVKIKRLRPDAVIPRYAKNGDAGFDLTAVSRDFDGKGNIVYGTGLAFEIPEGYVGLVFPRSSIADKELALTNAVGVVDSGYRGEVTAKFKPMSCFYSTVNHSTALSVAANAHIVYNVGERIAQMIILPYPRIEFDEVSELSQTERGTGGYGSSGK